MRLRREDAPEHGQHERGQIVGDLHLFAEEEIDADAEDQHVAHQRQAGQRRAGHHGRQQPGEQRHRALPEHERDDRKQRALAQRGGQRHDDDRIEDALGDEQRIVVMDGVVHRADNGHRADADGEGGGGEALDEAGVALAAALDAQPLAEALDVPLDVQDLAEQAAQAQRDDQQHGARRLDAAVRDDQNMLEGAGRADEDGAQPAGLDHDVLIALLERPAEEKAHRAAKQHAGGVDERTQSYHAKQPLLLRAAA